MAGFLPKSPENFHKIPFAKIAIISSQWHPEYVSAMVNRAESELLNLEVKQENILIYSLPGSLELPFAAGKLFESDPSIDAILAFGVVLKGDTTHDNTVLQEVVSGFGRISDRYQKPIINEVIGVNSLDDAKKRSQDNIFNKGVEAVFAVSEILTWVNSLKRKN